MVLAVHIAGDGIVQMAYQQEPMGILWVVTSDGQLNALTYMREHEVIGWHRHPIGGDGIVESVAVIPGSGQDEVWIAVRRTIGGTKRYIEQLQPNFEDTDTEDAFFVDSGLTYDGDPATVISELGHLNGQTVQVLADGSYLGTFTVSGGSITLPRAASKVHVGLQYNSNMETMRLEAPPGRGMSTSQGQLMRVSKTWARFYKTLGAKCGPDADNLDVIPFRRAGDDMAAQDVETEDRDLLLDMDYTDDPHIYVRQDQPLPMTLLALMYEFSVKGS